MEHTTLGPKTVAPTSLIEDTLRLIQRPLQRIAERTGSVSRLTSSPTENPHFGARRHPSASTDALRELTSGRF